MFRYVAVLLLTTCATAQDYRARVQGLITDSTQAAVPGAKVVLRNTATGIETNRESGPAGTYLFDAVEPGRYQLTAEIAGFSKAVRDNIVVQTRADVTVDVMLQPGQLTESVTVSASAEGVQLQFNSSTRELTVDGKMLKELPIKQRNPFTLALLDPAVVNRYGAERNPFFMWSSSSIDVGGSTNRKNDLLLDGAPLQLNQKGSYAPPMDAVQEFSVQQNSVDAEFGHSAGGVLSLSIKSGTNSYHGTAYYFGRNPKLNAVTNSVTRAGNLIRNHIAGGTIGGPIRKNKLFTFTSYEHWNTREPRNTLRTMPTDLERRGDFSQSQTIFNTLRGIYDPWTSRLDAANNRATRQPFPGNVIPASRIDPTAARFMQDIWGPNNPGDNVTGVNNFKTSYSWKLENWNFNNRTDWNINEKWKVFGRYSQLGTTLDQDNYTPNNSPAMTNDNGGLMNSRNIAGDAVYSLDARTIVNLRASFSELADDYNAPSAAIGEQGLATFWPNNPWYKPYSFDMPAVYYPQVTIGNNTLGRSSYWIQRPEGYNFSGKISRVFGKHYLKIGSEFRRQVANGRFPNLMAFSFAAGLTADTFIGTDVRRSGDSYATFLLGALDSGSTTQYVAPQSIRTNYAGLFLHDDYKITRRLTLNLGLRYEVSTPPIDQEDRFSRFLDLTQPIPEMQATPPRIPADVLALRTAPPIYNGAWVFTNPSNRNIYNTQKLTFMPRIGGAYRINDQTVVQAGFARYVVPTSLNTVTIERISFPGFSATTATRALIEGTPQTTLSRPFGEGFNPLQPIVGKGFGRYTNLGAGASWFDPNLRLPTNDRINFTIQRQLWRGFKFDGTYFMNLGRGLSLGRALNLTDPRISYREKAALSVNVANP
ncbi:MAG: carboxypeptidase regulatory-like domain-containing protein, partial [Bryobacterales bacterium]|nr:carboxypeptidase regulatory-like domain-containing protein [Bryobacterales bacterium]